MNCKDEEVKRKWNKMERKEDKKFRMKDEEKVKLVSNKEK